jgi:hypothetical protein
MSIENLLYCVGSGGRKLAIQDLVAEPITLKA